MISEQQYTQTTNLSHRKKFAQFFTPEPIANYMARWAVGRATESTVLEPAFGLGIFSRSVRKLSPECHIVAYDIDPYIYKVATENIKDSKHITLLNENYLTSSWNERYDAIICNPPYLKFHDYDNDSLVPVVNHQLGIRLTKFANLYTLFLLKSIHQLKRGGRCAYIIPSEFLNADYGVEVKRHLLEQDMQMHFIIVDFEENVFDGAITTACIVLCENNAGCGTIGLSKINHLADLETALAQEQILDKKMIRPDIKWKNYYEGSNSRKYKYLIDFSTYAKVSRGIATGANGYFSFTLKKASDYGISSDYLQKCVCHCTDIDKSIFSVADFDRLAQNGKSMYLFNGVGNEKDAHVNDYILRGEQEEVNKRFLCLKRKPWYALEQRKPAPIWVSVFSRNGLKFVRNEAKVTNLTTFHCVYITNEFVDVDIFYSYLLTDLAYQIFLDNSRQYGNGLVKFEPNDLNKSKVVDLGMLSAESSNEIKRLYNEFKIDEDPKYIEQIDNIFEQTFVL